MVPSKHVTLLAPSYLLPSDYPSSCKVWSPSLMQWVYCFINLEWHNMMCLSPTPPPPPIKTQHHNTSTTKCYTASVLIGVHNQMKTTPFLLLIFNQNYVGKYVPNLLIYAISWNYNIVPLDIYTSMSLILMIPNRSHCTFIQIHSYVFRLNATSI